MSIIASEFSGRRKRGRCQSFGCGFAALGLLRLFAAILFSQSVICATDRAVRIRHCNNPHLKALYLNSTVDKPRLSFYTVTTMARHGLRQKRKTEMLKTEMGRMEAGRTGRAEIWKAESRNGRRLAAWRLGAGFFIRISDCAGWRPDPAGIPAVPLSQFPLSAFCFSEWPVGGKICRSLWPGQGRSNPVKPSHTKKTGLTASFDGRGWKAVLAAACSSRETPWSAGSSVPLFGLGARCEWESGGKPPHSKAACRPRALHAKRHGARRPVPLCLSNSRCRPLDSKRGGKLQSKIKANQG